MNAHEEQLDLVAAYALGALDASEAAEAQAHLESCAECRAEYDALAPAVTALARAAESESVPSALLKARIMREVRSRSTVAPVASGSSRYTRGAVAAVLALAVGLGAWLLAGRSEAKHYAFAQGQIVVASDHISIDAHHLPPLPAGKVYQTWTLAQGAKAMTPSVTFEPDAKGAAHVELPGDAAHVVAVGISVEPAGGSKAPTTTPIAVVKLD
jgi:anti-sigma factor RsiW